MTARRWDGARSTGAIGALVVVGVLAVSSCGQPTYTAPPSPEFATGGRAQPTAATPDDDQGADSSEILLSAIEPDADGVDIGQMTLIDDTGIGAPNVSGWERFDDHLRERLVPASTAAAVAVMIDGTLVHEAAYGARVAGSSEPVDVADRFRIASISKPITAITALRLVEAGELTLDEPVGDRIAEHLGLASVDPDARSITLRELLSHTAGFPQHEGTFFSNGATSCRDAASQGMSRSVSGGSAFRYSNMSYCVVGVLLEAVTGKAYERVVDEQLLAPLGIDGMRLTSTYELGPDEVSHTPSAGRNFMEALGAAGAWNATPADIVTILNSVDPSTPGWKALSDESMNALRYRIPSALPPAGYGLGVINYDGDAWGHTGTLQNTHAMVLVQPDGVTWAITVSGEYPSSSGQLRSIMRRALSAAFPTS